MPSTSALARATRRGLEFFLEGKLGPFQGFAGYTYAITRRRFPSSGIPAEAHYYAPKYDRTNDANIVAAARLGRGWKVTSVFTYGTGQAYSPAIAKYPINTPFSTRPRWIVVSNYQGERLPPYHRLDAGFTKVGRFFGFADYELQLQVLNAYGRKNVWFYFYEVERNGEAKRNRINQIPIPLPNIALTLNF